MTSLARNWMNTVLALAIPAAGFASVTSSDSLMAHPPAVGITLGLGALWLAAVVALNSPRRARTQRVDRVRRDFHDPIAPRSVAPAYIVDVSRPLESWRWTSVLLAPIELFALAWSVPIMILLIMVPIGLALASALWLAGLILSRLTGA